MNIVVSLSAMVLSAGFTFHLGVENWINYGLFSFFSTLAVYNGQRVFKSEQLNETPWLHWVKKNKQALIFVVVTSSVSALLSLILLLNLNWKTMTILGVSGLISALYVIRLCGKNLRETPFLKIHLIALSWTLILIVFPIVNESIDTSKWLYGVAHYLFVLGVTIPFDIRDLKYDSVSQKTIPQLVGVPASKVIGVFAILIFGLLMTQINPVFIINPLFVVAIIFQILLLVLANERRSDAYYAGLIDGAIGVLGFSYFFCQH